MAVEASAISALKAEMSRASGRPVRVRTPERLADGERSVRELQALLAIDAGGISVHLGTLQEQALVEARPDGSSVRHRITDACVLQLMGLTRQMLSAQLRDTQLLLRDLNAPPPATSAS